MLSQNQKQSYQSIIHILRSHSDSDQLKIIEELRDFFDILEDDAQIKADKEARGHKEAGNEAVFLSTGRNSI